MAVQKKLLSRDEVEQEYGISKRWLENAAWRGDGPPFIRLGHRSVRYDRVKLEAWLEERTVLREREVA